MLEDHKDPRGIHAFWVALDKKDMTPLGTHLRIMNVLVDYTEPRLMPTTNPLDLVTEARVLIQRTGGWDILLVYARDELDAFKRAMEWHEREKHYETMAR